MITLDDIIVDPEDQWLLEQLAWHFDKDGYPKSTKWIDGVLFNFKLHHLVIDPPPVGWQTDHKNNVRHDCRKENLRYATPLGNRLNQAEFETYGILCNPSGTFTARVQFAGKRVRVGTFATWEAAKQARDAYMETLDVAGQYQPHNGQKSRNLELLQIARV